MPYNHSLRSQREVGFILTLNPCLMPYIKLWWHSKWGTTRRVGSVGSSETHLINRTENEMFRGVLTNCSIFWNKMKRCGKLLDGGAWKMMPCFSLPVIYKGNKIIYVIISFHIMETMCLICKELRLSKGLVALSLVVPPCPVLSMNQAFITAFDSFACSGGR